MTRTEICIRFKCKPETLAPRLKKWGCADIPTQEARRGQTKLWARKAVEQYLYDGSRVPSHRLKLLLWRDHLKPQHCEECGWAERSADGYIPLELHHLDGEHTNNTLENLLILCPNCHALKPGNSGRAAARHKTTR
ncbi:MAG TPA: HNH endonuclease signature motif containing protein [Chloroflexia bacterium]|nr:HNH endonuclease signature motif containing protein [Chloroflexia bacterium]